VNYYAVQVKPGTEDRYIRLLRAFHPEIAFPVSFPRRMLRIRRQGRLFDKVETVFPGYLFVEVDEDQAFLDARKAFRGIEGFYRFLPSSRRTAPLAGGDLETVLYFLKKASPIAGLSKVYFDENARIQVLEGPLLGLLGKIIKVDRRKGRAKVRLDLYEDSFCIDMGFETIRPLEGRG
jgi:transcriptional antiterminator NusG